MMVFTRTSNGRHTTRPTAASGRLLRVAVLLLTTLVARDSLTAQAYAQDAGTDQAASSTTAAAVDISVTEMRLNTITGLDALEGQIIVRLLVKNNSDKPIKLDQKQFSFSCAGKTSACNSAVVDPLLSSTFELAAGESKQGWMGINLTYAFVSEPVLTMTWANEQDPVGSIEINLNKALRDSSKLKTTLMGPDNCLAVVELHRPVDQLATWALTDEFKKLQAQNIRNVVLHVQADDQQKTVQSSYVTRTALAAWLGSVQAGDVPQRFGFANQVKCPVQFSRFKVAGMGSRDATGVNYGAAGSIYENDRDLAIAACLADVYDRIPLNEAIVDIHHAEPGIRRAAIEKNIDRLTETQLQQVIDESQSQSANYQSLIAENLYRVAHPTAVAALRNFANSDIHEVSQAAYKSLVKTSSSQAATALKEIWNSADKHSAIRRDIVAAIMSVNDYRHCDLLTDFASGLIIDATADAPGPITIGGDETDVPPGSSTPQVFSVLPDTTDSVGSRFNQSSSAEAQTLRKILAFLADQSELGALDTAKSEVLNVHDIAIQDVIVDFILQASTNHESSELAADYIRQRLEIADDDQSATPAVSGDALPNAKDDSRYRSKRLTTTLLNTVRRFPDSSYTDLLRQYVQESGANSTLSRQTFPAIMRCATDAQLTDMIKDFDSLDRYNRPQFLNQLSAIDHPAWLELTEQAMDGDEASWNTALTSLRDKGTPEATAVMAGKLDQVLADIDANPGKDLDVKSYRLADRLIMNLMISIDPVARKAINQCERSSSKQLSDLVHQRRIQAFGSDPHRQAVVEAYQLKRGKKHAEAMAIYTQLIKDDPFYARALVSRSSLYLREGKAQEALADIERALGLDPADAMTESMVALAKVRLDKVEEGIAMMENILAGIPDLQTNIRRDSLYNLACVYGRAIEVETEPKKRELYTTRGMDLLKQCTFRELGFDDVEHINDDPDLNVFHDHPEWDTLIQRIGENEKNQQLN
ncbi:MAG: HEAT repeat domain-containing protein [Fuerstiella sp.]